MGKVKAKVHEICGGAENDGHENGVQI